MLCSNTLNHTTVSGPCDLFSKDTYLCDNMNAINITKNSVQHSRTKHIQVRHHFMRDHIEEGSIILEFVP